MRNALLILLSVLLSVITQNRKSDNLKEVIDIFNAYNVRNSGNLSSIVLSVEYIPLETNSNILLSSGCSYEVTEEYIIVRNTDINFAQLQVFERKSGRYIKEIAKSGRGPSEYRIPVRDFYNIFNKQIYAYGNNNNIVSYDIGGKFLESFKLPEWDEATFKGGRRLAQLETYLNDNIFVDYIENTSGLEKRKIVLFSGEKVIKAYPNYLFWERKNLNRIYGFGNNCSFFHINNSLYFKEILNDTVFKVTQENLNPEYVFYAGKLSFPYSKREEYNTSEKYKKCLFIDRLFGNSGFLFFDLCCDDNRYFSFYDKKTKRTTVCDKIDKFPASLFDDINGFMPLRPLRLTQYNELIFELEAKRIKEWIVANPLKAKSLWGKFPWLKNITEMDNPVIVIAKCKS